MTATLVITDGTPGAYAVAEWLRTVADVRVQEARSRDDAIVLERCHAPDKGRILRIDGDLVSSEPLRFAGLSPFELRVKGREIVAKAATEDSELSERLHALARRVTTTATVRTGKRGRPRGSNPFAGAGFDVCVALLLHPGRQWTERALATHVGRTQSAVHKVLVALDDRRCVTRARGGISATNRTALRDDLLAAWRGVAASRKVVTLRAPGIPEVWRVLRRVKGTFVLAGASALPEDLSIVGGPAEAYADEAVIEVLTGRFREISPAAGTLEVRELPERGVLIDAIEGQPPRVNAVIALLDLVVFGGAREQRAAAELWSRIR